MIASPTLLVVGFVLLAVAVLLMNWASSRNLKDVAIGAALSAAWTLLWKRQRPGVPEELTTRVDEVRAQGTHVAKAKLVAGYAVKHFVAVVASLAGLLLFGLAVVLMALAVFWR
jgi:uncharacterized membrane protein